MMVPSKSSKCITIGLEQEGFLRHLDGSSPDAAVSCAWLGSIASKGGWEVVQTPSGPELVQERVSSCLGLPTRIHFDHFPHLWEVSCGPARRSEDLVSELELALGIMTEAAAKLNLEVLMQPFSPFPVMDPNLWGNQPILRDLRHTRQLTLARQGKELRPEWINFSAYIAATQVHFSSGNMDDDLMAVPALYLHEPMLLRSLMFRENFSQNMMRRRWDGYIAAYAAWPLVGYPDLPNWSVGAWEAALQNAPLLGSIDDKWAGKSIRESQAVLSHQEMLTRVRDQQIVKPRPQGTLEFRADPALRSVDAIRTRVAERMEVFSSIDHKKIVTEDEFSEARAQWWSAILGEGEALTFLSK